MKRRVRFLSLALALMLCVGLLAGCNSSGDQPSKATSVESPSETPPESPSETPSETPSEEPSEVSEPKPTPTPMPTPTPVATMTEAEFQDLLARLPVTVEDTDYIVQDEKYKALYPDMLQAVIANHTEVDIKDAVVAFVAWDANNLPVKIKSSMDFNDGAYIKEVKYRDINMIPGATFGESSGFEIEESCGIESFRAIVVSFESFDGDTWKNPYYNAWQEMYEGVKYTDSLTVEVKEMDASFTPSADVTQVTSEDEASILAEIETQEVRVTSTQYVVQDARYKALYPDMLQAVIINEADADIKDAVVAFVAWDKNGLPVKIKVPADFSDGTYIRQVNYSDINLVPGGTYGESSGFEVDENCGIDSFQAIVVSYETFDGESWKNPLYKDWKALYEGVRHS